MPKSKKTTPNPLLELGQTVTWTSQASASTKVKQGTIVEVVHAGFMPDRTLFPRLYSGSGVGLWRDHVSYVVRVDPPTGSRAQPNFYWPHANKLIPSFSIASITPFATSGGPISEKASTGQTAEMNQPHFDAIAGAREKITDAEHELVLAVHKAYPVGARLVRNDGKRESHFTVVEHSVNGPSDIMRLRNDNTGNLSWQRVVHRDFSLRTFLYKTISTTPS